MDFVEQVKSAVDIVSVVREYVPRLQKAGQSYKGLCPFHSEKTPSFNVHPSHQFYKCFSCGAGGDVFKFVMAIEGISFYEALKSLAERNGIPMPKRSQYADDDSRLRGAIFQMHELAQEAFHANLHGPAGEEARAYLARRGVSRETAELFGLGYSERGGRGILRLLEQRGFPALQLEQSGLVRKRDDGSFYDYFRNRLMFPIHNETGKIIGYGGRSLSAEDNPKYLNSPETPIYKKSHVLYNLHRAKESVRKEDRVILVEGYMDVIGVTAAGFHGVVASCGTSLTLQQVQLLKRHSPRITVNFDPDAAGANAAHRSIDLLLQENMQVRIMELDGGLDPDEYCKERGAEAYQERLDHAKGFFYWLADRQRSTHDMRTTEGRVAVLQSLIPVLGRITDRLERMTVANDLAGYIGVDSGMVLDSFRKSVADRQEKAFERPKVALRHDERILLNALLIQGEGAAEVLERLKTVEVIHTFPSRRIFQAILALDETGGKLSFDAVNARLEEADQTLLAEIVLGEEIPNSSEEVLAAVERVCLSDEHNRIDQLRARIRELERAGNLPEAMVLMAQLPKLDRGARGRR